MAIIAAQPGSALLDTQADEQTSMISMAMFALLLLGEVTAA